MTTYYGSEWAAGWSWLLWVGMVVLFFSVIGNWGYTYRAHQKYYGLSAGKSALDILNERYAKGEITKEEYRAIKSEITSESVIDQKKAA